MSDGENEIKIFATKCANCGHPQLRHMKVPHQYDPQRWKLLGRDKPVYTPCQDCIKEDKKCKGFKPKK